MTYRVKIFVLNEHIKTIEKSAKKRYNTVKEYFNMKIIIVGGVAGGATAAARIRR